MNYFHFFRANTKILTFVVLLTFFSGFGQTYLLSIYIPHFIEAFAISRTFYSTLYSLATILSGITIIFAGKIIDKVPIKLFAMVVVLGLAMANITAGLSYNVSMLFISIFLLRFFGQGLSSHTAFTIAGKYFDKARGKALSIAYLGFPFAEGLMPSVVLLGIAFFGWRNNFMLSAFTVIAILLPLTILLLHKFNPSVINEKGFESTKDKRLKFSNSSDKTWTQKDVLKNKLFYYLAPMPFLIGFLITAVFFFQTFIADFKGWSVEWMALNIVAYAISSFTFSILSGPIIDRFSARSVFPFMAIPLVVGFAFLLLFNHPFAACPYWFFVGISAGMSSTVATACYAESYGVKSLGAVRSLFTFVMIIGTALGPVFYSILLDAALSFTSIKLILSTVVILYSIVLFRLNLKLLKKI